MFIFTSVYTAYSRFLSDAFLLERDAHCVCEADAAHRETPVGDGTLNFTSCVSTTLHCGDSAASLGAVKLRKSCLLQVSMIYASRMKENGCNTVKPCEIVKKVNINKNKKYLSKRILFEKIVL